jgi:serine/threonine protein kinase
MGAPPKAAEPLRCGKCGRDVAEEIGQRRGGDYLCQSCLGKAEADPAGTMLDIVLQRARSHPGDGEGMGAYEIGSLLGQGGMGAVYLARRKRDGREVALKVMLSKVAVNEYARNVFQREIEVMRDLRHARIVELLEHGSSGSVFYFVMELCPGGGLDGHLRKAGGCLPLGSAGAIMLEALEGLAFAHDKGYVHRDLKPANILLTHAGGGAKVSDFGFAKGFQKAGLSGMTATGAAAGTFTFMPREQIVNFKYVKPPSDVWSMAATFYHLLTGRYPLDFPPGADPVDLILRGGVVPIRNRDTGVPEKVAAVIDQALAEKVADRYQTAGEFRDALARVL